MATTQDATRGIMYFRASGRPGRYTAPELARILGVTSRNLKRSWRRGWRVHGHRIDTAGPRTPTPPPTSINPQTGHPWHVRPRDGFPLWWLPNGGSSVRGGTWAKRSGGKTRCFGPCAVEAEQRYRLWLVEHGLLKASPRRQLRPTGRVSHSLDASSRWGGRGSTLAETVPNQTVASPTADVMGDDVLAEVSRGLDRADVDAVRRCWSNGDHLPADVTARMIATVGAAGLRELLTP